MRAEVSEMGNQASAQAAGSRWDATSSDLGALARGLGACAVGLVESARALDWSGPDPYDGLYWKWPATLVATPRRRQVVVQLHARAPVDIRIWRRQAPPRLAKTLALFTNAALLLAEVQSTPDMTGAARDAVGVLNADRSAGEDAWGYPFPVQTRWSRYEAGAPNIVVTAFAAEALARAAKQFDEQAFAERARGSAKWAREKLLTPAGHFAYHEHSDVLIHNANLVGAATVHRMLGSDEADVVRRAVEITLGAQRPDGSWPYGLGERLEFVDSFHTAYVLSSLVAMSDIDPAIESAILRGARYWAENFFDDSGRARLWSDRRFPEDGHSAGTALSTLARLAEYGPAYRDLLHRVAVRALDSMIHRGRAVHRRQAWGRARVNYLRWCDGHMAVGMAAGAAGLAAA